jgi:hypothetical protein
MQWLFSALGGNATLAYAVPGGSGIFSAVCVAHAGSATVTLAATAPDVRPGKYVTVSLAAGATARTYNAIGSPRGEADGSSRPVVSVPLSDPIWPAIITERSLAIGIATAPPTVISLAGSAPQVNQFLALCGSRSPQPQANSGSIAPPYPAPPPYPAEETDGPAFPPMAGQDQRLPPPGVPLPPGNVGGGRDVDYACDDGSDISVSFYGNTAVVDEPGRPPTTLFQAPSQQGTRYVNHRMQLVGDGENVYWRRGGGDTATCSPQ